MIVAQVIDKLKKDNWSLKSLAFDTPSGRYHFKRLSHDNYSASDIFQSFKVTNEKLDNLARTRRTLRERFLEDERKWFKAEFKLVSN